MLVPFVVDPESLRADQNWTGAQHRSCHGSLLDVWQRLGLLVYDGVSFSSSNLYAEIQALPLPLRTLWQEVLVRVPMAAAGNGWSGRVHKSEIAEIATIARLGLVDDATAEVEFGMTEAADALEIAVSGRGAVTVSRILSAAQVAPFIRAQEMANTHIEVGHSYGEIWETRFQALAQAPIKSVIIVDRFAMSQHFDCPQTRLSGLDRFLRLLNASARGPRDVTVFSTWTDRVVGGLDRVRQEMQDVLSRLQGQGVRRLKVFMVPNGAFGVVAHDRFVRFDRYVWDLGGGIHVFEGPAASARSSATFKAGFGCDGYRAVEQDLRTYAEAQSFEIGR